MRKVFKISVLSVLMPIFVAACALFAVNNYKTAKAADDAFSTIEKSVFEMEDGVTLKLNEDGGMRFVLKMDETVKNYIGNDGVESGFIIAPKQLMTAANGDYYNMSQKLTVKIESDKIYLDTDNFYHANGCVVKMREENRKLDYVAVGYIKSGDNVKYTEYNDNARGNFYKTVNDTLLSATDYTDDVLSLNAYKSWFATKDYPVSLKNEDQVESYNRLLGKVGKSAYIAVNGVNKNIVMANATQYNYLLTEDIDMESSCWEHSETFSGTFDGNGYAIKNISFNGKGLFNDIDGASIKNIVLENINATGVKSVFTGKNNITKNVTLENAVIDVNTVTSPEASRFAIFGYQTAGTITMNNVVIDMASGINNTYFGFITAHAGTKQIYNNVICVGKLNLHSTEGNSGYVPDRKKSDGTTAAVVGEDYVIDTDIVDAMASAVYGNVSDFIKTTVPELYGIKLLNKNNIEAELLNPTTGYYLLEEDIDMSEFKSWGNGRTGDYLQYYFKGTLNGNGHTISNFKVTQPTFKGGLLWSLDGATIKNIIFKNAEITVADAGLIASRAKNTPVIENVFVEITSMTNSGNGILSACEENNTFKNVAVYVKAVTGTGSSSGALGGTYVRSVRVGDFYFITDTNLSLAPIHSSVKTAIKNATGSADAVENTDYFKYTTEQAKTADKSTLKTELLRKAFGEAFAA